MSTSEMEVTKRLAEWVCESEFRAVPDDVRREAARTLLNWMGCAVGGSGHESIPPFATASATATRSCSTPTSPTPAAS